MKKNRLIFKTGNRTFWLLTGLYAISYFTVCTIGNRFPIPVRQYILAAFCVANIILFFIYKYLMSKDQEYADIYYANMGGFSWWYELPLHLCNINMFTCLIGALTRIPQIMGFAFFVGPIGALMAILMPDKVFNDYSFTYPRMWGYYLTHFSIIHNCFLLLGLKLYFPEYFHLLPILVFTIELSFGAFVLNVILRKSKIAPFANYFYTIDAEENKVLELFQKWIPVSYLYLIPAVAVLLIYMYAVTFLLHL